MNLTLWTFAQNGLLPKAFPQAAFGAAHLLLAGGPAGHAHSLQADPANFAACLNEAARRANDGLVIFAPPDLVDLHPNALRLLTAAADNHPAGCFFYGDYLLRGAAGDELVNVRADIGDITEREDWGPLWAVRASWLNAGGGLDEHNPRAAFYDLLLKSWGKGRRMHVGGALAVIPAPVQDAAADATRQKLFFPGRGKLGGFSYLFMDPEDERQTETVFYNFLHREHAWLEDERRSFPPAGGGARGGGISGSGVRGEGTQARISDFGFRISDFPLVSVVTPVYNRARFIGKAIASVQRQTFTDWEYVVVDNGSTDNTRDVVKEIAANDPRVRLIENDQNIIALSLNLGVKAARGKYISQLDSDDEYPPITLEKMVAELEAHPTWGIAIGYYELMDEAGTVLPEFGVIRHLEYNRNNILRVDGAGAPRMWHRAVILEFGGFDEQVLGHYGEDYDLVLKCGEKYEVGRVHEICYYYRRHEDNTDVKRDPEMKIKNKTLARLNALSRRRALNGL